MTIRLEKLVLCKISYVRQDIVHDKIVVFLECNAQKKAKWAVSLKRETITLEFAASKHSFFFVIILKIILVYVCVTWNQKNSPHPDKLQKLISNSFSETV